MLKLDDSQFPPKLLGWDDPDAIAAWIEKLIVHAERQLPGTERGPERMDAVVEVVATTVDLPDVAATLPPGASVMGRRELARMLCQLVYSTLVRNMPAHLRSGGE